MGLDKKTIKKACVQVFQRYDRDRSGNLDTNEFYGALCEVFAMCKHAPPPQYQASQEMSQFDKNRDGRINEKEFKKIVKSNCQFEKKKKKK